MIPLRLLNAQGIVGLAASAILSLLLVIQHAETRHWQGQSARFETLAGQARSALDLTEARVRAAAAEAEASDRRNAERVRTDQAAITKDITHDFEARLADARARAQRLRLEGSAAPTARGDRPVADLPRLPAAPGGAAQAAGEGRLPAADALTATEQALQLDALIQWVREQSELDQDSAKGPTKR